METNIVTGTIFSFEEAVFTGTYPKSKFSHNANHTVKVLKESYGGKRGQHSFTLEVIESDEKRTGEIFRKMGRNIYPTMKVLKQPENYLQLAESKRKRAEDAKYNKYLNWYQEAIFEGKEFKLDKIPKQYLKEFEGLF